MENVTRIFCASISFVIPLVGIVLYLVYTKKLDAKLFGIISFIGILVYLSVGTRFI